MRTVLPVILAGLIPVGTKAQAPQSAELWRLSASSLALPAGLERGSAAMFWNPAAPDLSRRLAGGIELTQTPDVIGVAGFIGGLHYRVRPGLAAIVFVGRVDIDDIVRTTTSATSDLGTIPIYEQVAGVGTVLALGPAQAGVLLRGHDARFDAVRESGITVDAGVRLALHRRLIVGGASHFFPLDLVSRDLTDYFLGADFLLGTRPLLGGAAQFHARYGATHRETTGTDHGVGLGFLFEDQLGADAILVRERGYVESVWRPVLGLSLRVGRYLIRVSRGSGLNDIGATYRVGLESDILP